MKYLYFILLSSCSFIWCMSPEEVPSSWVMEDASPEKSPSNSAIVDLSDVLPRSYLTTGKTFIEDDSPPLKRCIAMAHVALEPDLNEASTASLSDSDDDHHPLMIAYKKDQQARRKLSMPCINTSPKIKPQRTYSLDSPPDLTYIEDFTGNPLDLLFE